MKRDVARRRATRRKREQLRATAPLDARARRAVISSGLRVCALPRTTPGIPGNWKESLGIHEFLMNS